MTNYVKILDTILSIPKQKDIVLIFQKHMDCNICPLIDECTAYNYNVVARYCLADIKDLNNDIIDCIINTIVNLSIEDLAYLISLDTYKFTHSKTFTKHQVEVKKFLLEIENTSELDRLFNFYRDICKTCKNYKNKYICGQCHKFINFEGK